MATLLRTDLKHHFLYSEDTPLYKASPLPCEFLPFMNFTTALPLVQFEAIYDVWALLTRLDINVALHRQKQ